jgi:cytochrome P450
MQVLERSDLLSLFMSAESQAESGATAFSDRYLRDVILNFLIAGRDTTVCAAALCCMFGAHSKALCVLCGIRHRL